MLTNTHPPKRNKRRTLRSLLWIVGILAALFVIGVILGSPSRDSGNQSSSSQENTTQSEASSSSRQANKPMQFSGSGSDVIQFTNLHSGLRTFKYSYSGRRYFSMWLIDEDRRDIGLIGNGSGSTSGAKAIRVPRTCNCVINVEADEGSWTLEVAS